MEIAVQASNEINEFSLYPTMEPALTIQPCIYKILHETEVLVLIADCCHWIHGEYIYKTHPVALAQDGMRGNHIGGLWRKAAKYCNAMAQRFRNKAKAAQRKLETQLARLEDAYDDLKLEFQSLDYSGCIYTTAKLKMDLVLSHRAAFAKRNGPAIENAVEEITNVKRDALHWSRLDLYHNCFDPEEMSNWINFAEVRNWHQTRFNQNNTLRPFLYNGGSPRMPGDILSMLTDRKLAATSIRDITIEDLRLACLSMVARDSDPEMMTVAMLLGADDDPHAMPGTDSDSDPEPAPTASSGAGTSADPFH
jgi:hypothetical protein